MTGVEPPPQRTAGGQGKATRISAKAHLDGSAIEGHGCASCLGSLPPGQLLHVSAPLNIPSS